MYIYIYIYMYIYIYTYIYIFVCMWYISVSSAVGAPSQVTLTVTVSGATVFQRKLSQVVSSRDTVHLINQSINQSGYSIVDPVTVFFVDVFQLSSTRHVDSQIRVGGARVRTEACARWSHTAAGSSARVPRASPGPSVSRVGTIDGDRYCFMNDQYDTSVWSRVSSIQSRQTCFSFCLILSGNHYFGQSHARKTKKLSSAPWCWWGTYANAISLF